MANTNDKGSGVPPQRSSTPGTKAPGERVAPSRPPAIASLSPAPAPPRVAPAIPAVKPLSPLPPAPRAPAGRPPGIPALGPVSKPVAPPAPARDVSTNLLPAELADLFDRASRLDELDYFEVLKIDRSAGIGDIKKAFYRESRTFHPDRFFQLDDALLKDKVNEVYKRVTEAYFFLRDDAKRKRYLVDISGAERAQKLRFTELSEAETKLDQKKEQEEQIGSHPKGRQFFQTGMADFLAERWSAAERNFKMALTYEPQNPRYKEKLAEVQSTVAAQIKARGEGFKIK